ncbi:hypothetical protein ONS96_002089 [Cadophora gregata f. sp. sojae]|nr:hypothetical protein ONS96_002089 [Cadophora gregata f. sp. sojae]
MAGDPLSIAASILGVSAAGFKIAQGLYNIASSIGSSGEEIRLFASDTDIFSHMLYSLSQTLESTAANSTSHSPRLLVTTEDAVKLCEQVLQPFERIIKRLNPLLVRFKESQRKLKQLGMRIRWVFREKSKVLFYQRMLNSLKSTLTCLLASTNLNVASDLGAEHTALLRIQVENAQGVIKHNVEMAPTRLLELGATNAVAYPGRTLQDVPSESQVEMDGLEDDAFIVPRSDAGPSASRRDTRVAEDNLDSQESFDCQIDEALQSPPGSTSCSPQALYEDIRSLQRRIIEFASQTLETADDLPPSYDLPTAGNSDGRISGLRENTNSNVVDRQGLSIMIPYQVREQRILIVE